LRVDCFWHALSMGSDVVSTTRRPASVPAWPSVHSWVDRVSAKQRVTHNLMQDFTVLLSTAKLVELAHEILGPGGIDDCPPATETLRMLESRCESLLGSVAGIDFLRAAVLRCDVQLRLAVLASLDGCNSGAVELAERARAQLVLAAGCDETSACYTSCESGDWAAGGADESLSMCGSVNDEDPVTYGAGGQCGAITVTSTEGSCTEGEAGAVSSVLEALVLVDLFVAAAELALGVNVDKLIARLSRAAEVAVDLGPNHVLNLRLTQGISLMSGLLTAPPSLMGQSKIGRLSSASGGPRLRKDPYSGKVWSIVDYSRDSDSDVSEACVGRLRRQCQMRDAFRVPEHRRKTVERARVCPQPPNCREDYKWSVKVPQDMEAAAKTISREAALRRGKPKKKKSTGAALWKRGLTRLRILTFRSAQPKGDPVGNRTASVFGVDVDLHQRLLQEQMQGWEAVQGEDLLTSSRSSFDSSDDVTPPVNPLRRKAQLEIDTFVPKSKVHNSNPFEDFLHCEMADSSSAGARKWLASNPAYQRTRKEELKREAVRVMETARRQSPDLLYGNKVFHGLTTRRMDVVQHQRSASPSPQSFAAFLKQAERSSPEHGNALASLGKALRASQAAVNSQARRAPLLRRSSTVSRGVARRFASSTFGPGWDLAAAP